MKSRLLSLFLLVTCCSIVYLPVVGCGGSSAVQNSSSAPTTALAIQSVTPNIIPAGSTALVITVSGSGFTRSSQVTVNSIQMATIYVSANELQATISAGQFASGTLLQVGVTNGEGNNTSTAVGLSVENPQPVLSKINPSIIPVGSSGANVILSGSGFVPTSVANINGSARPTAFTSATQLTLSLTASDLASVTTSTITVINSSPGGGASSAQTLNVVNPLPVITSISPSNLTPGNEGTTLEITGSGFLPSTTVLWNNNPLAAKFISSTQFSATIPSAIPAAGNSASVTLSNPAPGGGLSAAVSIPVLNPAPVLTSILPGNIATGSASSTISLTGSKFETASVVQWNGSPRATAFLNSQALQVTLTQSDLANSGMGRLTVTNPAPGGGISSASNLNVTSSPIPVIQAITFDTASSPGCSTVRATITGTNFGGQDIVRLNGISLQLQGVIAPVFGSNNTWSLLVPLPAADIPKSGPLSFTVSSLFYPSVVSDPYTVPSATPGIAALCSSPAPATIYPNTGFSVSVSASAINAPSTATITVGALPAGITLTSPASVSIPSSGATFQFAAASSILSGSNTIPITGRAGSIPLAVSIQLNVVAGSPPSLFFTQPLTSELAISPGGSGQIQFSTVANGTADYTIVPSVSGLPLGTTASFSPSTIIPGQYLTVTIAAQKSAPVTQNVTVTLTGTPAAAVSAATAKFLLDVTPPPGSLPTNRSDFTSTAGTPYAAVYDATHNQIFASNASWNRIDVISNQSRKIVGSINIRDPHGLDISTDNSTIWVATGSQQIYSINTTTFVATRFVLPNINGTPGNAWEGGLLFTLSDGTVLLQTNPFSSGATFIWTPSTNTLTSLNGFTGSLVRSGDHSHVYSTSVNSVSCQTSVYDVSSKTLRSLPTTSERCGFNAANMDGSRLVGSNNGTFGVYDANGNLIGNLPGAADTSGISFYGGFVFSSDGSTLYQIGAPAKILTYDVASLTLKGTAPALATLPVGASETENLTTPFAVDSTGMVLGIQDFGIGFDDSTFFQTYASQQPGENIPVFLTPNAGPLAGGTSSTPYGSYGLTPDVWYGPNRGSASLASNNDLTIKSPLGDAVGPVNLKYLYPDGNQIFTPQAFSYSTYPQYATLAGASPSGGVPGQIAGYGMPVDASGATMTVGSQAATTTTVQTQYPPYTGEPFPSTFLNYTIPSGNPGWEDLQIQTPIGTGTLLKSVFYAKSVTDYGSPDTFTAVVYDRKRNQVYLSAKNHIDVFSMASSQFLTPLMPAIRGANSQFAGLALTPDGSELLAANTLDGSLAVINPETPSSTYAIPIAEFSGTNNCLVGPLYVAATSTGQAFVTTGSIPGIVGCPSEGNVYIVNLAAKTASTTSGVGTCSLYQRYPFTTSFGVDATLDGSMVVMGSGTFGTECLYTVASNTYTQVAGSTGPTVGVTMSPDGNIVGSGVVLDDASGRIVGRLSHPAAFYGSNFNLYSENVTPTGALFNPRLNDAGSLYFWPFPNYFEIIDVPTGRLRLRFSLAETVQNVITPLALDGAHDVFLITDKGLTVVDLGSAPLSVGDLSSSVASPGTQVEIRGSGFETGMTATVGGQLATLTFTDQNTITLTVPSLASGSADLLLTDPDGSTYTLQSAITIP
ncbi:MAG: IPT/TIG domain-containing protein [Edaphobacter sp.]